MTMQPVGGVIKMQRLFDYGCKLRQSPPWHDWRHCGTPRALQAVEANFEMHEVTLGRGEWPSRAKCGWCTQFRDTSPPKAECGVEVYQIPSGETLRQIVK